MVKAIAALIVVLGLAAVGGWLYLAYGNFPVAATRVEKVLPNARFPK
ncbi:MAG TPA: hypothetical protein VMF86_10265 [Stellaceae bacterium]|nr:hypothetical protein [Stellaceae bacterium]